MKKIINSLLFILITNSILGNVGVKTIVQNNTTKTFNLTDSHVDWGWIVGDLAVYNTAFKQLKSNNLGTDFQNGAGGSGVSGFYEFTAEDNSGVIRINFDNPWIGSSEYSVTSSVGLYNIVITSINDDANPQVITVEITGGKPNPTPPIIINTIGNNVITGKITWDELLQGTAPTPVQSNFLIKCKVPSLFFPTENGTSTYNGLKGNYNGSVNTGKILWGNVVAEGTKRILTFTITQVANEVDIKCFDVFIQKNVKFTPPTSKQTPGVGFEYEAAIINTLGAAVKEGSGFRTEFAIVAGWIDKKNGSTLDSDLSSAMQQRKNNRVLPSNVFLNSNNNANSINTIKNNSIKQETIRQTRTLDKSQIKIKSRF